MARRETEENRISAILSLNGSVAMAAWVLAIVVTGYLLWQTRFVLLILFAGILLGVLLYSISERLERWTGLPRLVALPLILLVAAGMFGLIAWQAGPTLAQQVEELLSTLASRATQLGGELQDDGGKVSTETLLSHLPSPSGIASGATAVAGSVMGAVATGLIVLFIGIYLAASPHHYSRLALTIVPARHREKTKTMLYDAAHILHHWMIGQIISMSVLGFLSYVGLLYLGLPLALLLAVFAGLANFVPYLGPILAAIPMLAVAAGEGWQLVFWVAGLYLILQILESYLLTPLIQSRAIQLLPAIVIANQLLMGAVFGIAGFVLATPLAAVAVIPLRHLTQER